MVMKEVTLALTEEVASFSSAVIVTVCRPGRGADDVELDFFLMTVIVTGSLLSSVVAGVSASTVVVTVTV